MTLGQAECYSPLINKHKHSILLLRAYIEGLFPDLKANPNLEDGTKVDDLFYLRYVLSAKEPIITNDQIPDSAETKNIIKQLQWRKEQLKLCPSWKSKDYNQVLHPKESQFLSTIPLYRTGELPNQYPVIVLPVRNVDFDTFFRNQENKEFEKELLSFMLVQKERIFREVDAKSREKSALIKSVTVYDLNGISYSSIYKLTKFFKLVQGQTKIFKAFFPQSTHSTVILNPPGTWMLKMFSKSKKQRVMSLDEFLNEYEARSAVPDFLNGTSPWPEKIASSTGIKNSLLIEGEDMESLVSVDSSKSTGNGMEKNTLNFEELELKRTIHEWTKKESPNKLTVQSSNLAKNVKIALTNLEREMVYMKKNKIFSIDVLGSNQDVNLFFTNLRNKPANILIAVKEEQRGKLYENNTTDNKMYSVVNSSTALKPGLNHFRLHCDNPGEILLIYVSRDKVGKSDVHSIETMDIRKTRKRQVLNYGKRVYKNVVRSPRSAETPIGLSGLNEIPLHAQNPNPSANKFQDKLFFRFEVGDAVMAGNYAGITSVKESKVQLTSPTKGGRNSISSVTISRVNNPADHLASPEKLKYKTRRNKDGLIEFDDRSTLTSSSGGSRNEGFFRAFGQIFGLK